MIMDIMQTICSFCHIKSQIRAISINSLTNSCIYIYKIHFVEDKYKVHRNKWPFDPNNVYNNITQRIIEQKKFSKLKCLHLGTNNNVRDINHLKNTLVELSCFDCRSLTKIGVSDLLKLRVLHCKNIFDLKKLSNSLEELHIEKMRQDDINDLNNLKCLHYHQKNTPFSPNRKYYIGDYNLSPVKSFYHLACTLKKLDCSNSSIDQNVINQLKKLEILVCKNTSISDVNHLSDSLRELYCSRSEIHQSGISELKCLEKLECYGQNIYNVDHLSSTLTHIYHSYIDQSLIQNTNRVKCISAIDHNIHNLEHLRGTLTYLDISTKYIPCDVIKNMDSIVSFGGNICGTYECSFTKSLKHLRVTWEISQEEINMYHRLESLIMENRRGYPDGITSLDNNARITDLNHLSETLEIVICHKNKISTYGLSRLYNIKYICMYECENILDIHHMHKINKKIWTNDSICGIEYHR